MEKKEFDEERKKRLLADKYIDNQELQRQHLALARSTFGIISPAMPNFVGLSNVLSFKSPGNEVRLGVCVVACR